MSTLKLPKTDKPQRPTGSIRREIKSRLNRIEDREFLRTVLKMVRERSAKYDSLPEFAKKKIEEGIQAAQEGRVTSDEEMRKEFAKWLDED